jgi:hypothetical protein
MKWRNMNLWLLLIPAILIVSLALIMMMWPARYLEPFYGSLSVEEVKRAFDLPGLTNFVQPTSQGPSKTTLETNWYPVKPQSVVSTGSVDITKGAISVAFLLKIDNYFDGWRNIFRFTNNLKDLDEGSRLPALFISPNNSGSASNQLHLCWPDKTSSNHYTFSGKQYGTLMTGTTYLVSVSHSFDGKNTTISWYLNAKKMPDSGSYPGGVARNSNTLLYIRDGFYNTEPNYEPLIQNFTIYQGELTQEHNNLIKNALDYPTPIAGPPGPQGPPGVPGSIGPTGAPGTAGPTGAPGTAGTPGAAGAAGTPGLAGATGPQGLQGNIGPTGPIGLTGADGVAGPTGPRGPVGEKGDKGDKGEQGIPGKDAPRPLTIGSAGTLTYSSIAPDL